MPVPAAPRPLCPACLRPQRTCLCAWRTPTDHAVEVLVLQHPLEVAQAKGSARLLHLCLPHSRLVVGEAFADARLLTAPWGTRPAPQQVLLLYPDTVGMPRPPVSAQPLHPARLRLVVLDGTWRKSRKMLHLSPPLQQLPRLPLHDVPPSRYRIRKAHRPDQLSTLEATCAALAQLEGDPARYQPLLAAFDGFVAQQAGYVPCVSPVPPVSPAPPAL